MSIEIHVDGRAYTDDSPPQAVGFTTENSEQLKAKIACLNHLKYLAKPLRIGDVCAGSFVSVPQMDAAIKTYLTRLAKLEPEPSLAPTEAEVRDAARVLAAYVAQGVKP